MELQTTYKGMKGKWNMKEKIWQWQIQGQPVIKLVVNHFSSPSTRGKGITLNAHESWRKIREIIVSVNLEQILTKRIIFVAQWQTPISNESWPYRRALNKITANTSILGQSNGPGMGEDQIQAYKAEVCKCWKLNILGSSENIKIESPYKWIYSLFIHLNI